MGSWAITEMCFITKKTIEVVFIERSLNLENFYSIIIAVRVIVIAIIRVVIIFPVTVTITATITIN